MQSIKRLNMNRDAAKLADLKEQIIRDYQTIQNDENPQPSKLFYTQRIVDYKGELELTAQEELFSELFNHEKILVKDMDTLMLRAHREELAKIAFEARARLTAVDDEDNERKKIARGSKDEAGRLREKFKHRRYGNGCNQYNKRTSEKANR